MKGEKHGTMIRNAIRVSLEAKGYSISHVCLLLNINELKFNKFMNAEIKGLRNIGLGNLKKVLTFLELI